MYPGKHAIDRPNKKAAIHALTGESVTYLQLDQRSNQLAHLFRSHGIEPGDHVAIFMENNLRFFEVCWAALRSGLYITPINRYLTAEEAGYILNDCEAKALISSHALASVAVNLPQYADKCCAFYMVDKALAPFQSYELAIATQSNEKLEDEPTGQFMLYSSGTTGRPKGIIRPRAESKVGDSEGIIAGMFRGLWQGDENTVYFSPAPLYHSAPANFTMAVQAMGGTVVVAPKFDELEALQALSDYKVTHSQWVPTMFSRFLKMPADLRGGYDLSSHKVALHAAAPCPIAVKQEMLNWWGDIIYEYYAGTESNGFTHVTPEQWRENPGTVGKSLLGPIHICDENGNELPVGEPGLVYFEMPFKSFSYHGDSKKTAEIEHPSYDSWTALGDVGYVNAEGFLFLTDRASFMIISGGVNIYPQEIENELIMHPKVLDVAVIGVPNDEMGEEVKAVVQLVAGVEANDQIAAELYNYAREKIAHYKCPKSVDFIDEMPRLPTGKLYKRQLKDRYWGEAKSRIL